MHPCNISHQLRDWSQPSADMMPLLPLSVPAVLPLGTHCGAAWSTAVRSRPLMGLKPVQGGSHAKFRRRAGVRAEQGFPLTRRRRWQVHSSPNGCRLHQS
jgi:hypothetical protein